MYKKKTSKLKWIIQAISLTPHNLIARTLVLINHSKCPNLKFRMKTPNFAWLREAFKKYNYKTYGNFHGLVESPPKEKK